MNQWQVVRVGSPILGLAIQRLKPSVRFLLRAMLIIAVWPLLIALYLVAEKGGKPQ